MFIFCSSLFIFSLFVPVFSATKKAGIHNNDQNLFSDLSRNLTLPDFQENKTSDTSQENNTSDTNPEPSSINDQAQPQSDDQSNDSKKSSK